MPAPVLPPDPGWVVRFVPLRASKLEADERELAGTPIVFNSLSQDLGGFVERIAPSAVDRTLQSGANVDALLDHRRETTHIIGSTDSGTLRLKKTPDGLRSYITPPDTTVARDAITVIKAGLVKGMSFAFRVWPDWQEWDEDEHGRLVRTITDMEFSEVSVVVNPAYLATAISARNAAEDRAALEAYRARAWRPSLAFRERVARLRRV